jgi:hypothetical protein
LFVGGYGRRQQFLHHFGVTGLIAQQARWETHTHQ